MVKKEKVKVGENVEKLIKGIAKKVVAVEGETEGTVEAEGR